VWIFRAGRKQILVYFVQGNLYASYSQNCSVWLIAAFCMYQVTLYILCMCVCMYIYIYIYTHTHTHTQKCVCVELLSREQRRLLLLQCQRTNALFWTLHSVSSVSPVYYIWSDLAVWYVFAKHCMIHTKESACQNSTDGGPQDWLCCHIVGISIFIKHWLWNVDVLEDECAEVGGTCSSMYSTDSVVAWFLVLHPSTFFS
jgi:hypothetical protein